MNVGLVFAELTIPRKEIEFFKQMACPLSLKEGEYFVAPDTRCDQIAFIDSGLLGSIKITGQDKFILSRHSEYQFVSVFTSFLTGERSSWAILALELPT
jgi:hypothetical protein